MGWVAEISVHTTLQADLPSAAVPESVLRLDCFQGNIKRCWRFVYNILIFIVKKKKQQTPSSYLCCSAIVSCSSSANQIGFQGSWSVGLPQPWCTKGEDQIMSQGPLLSVFASYIMHVSSRLLASRLEFERLHQIWACGFSLKRMKLLCVSNVSVSHQHHCSLQPKPYRA